MALFYHKILCSHYKYWILSYFSVRKNAFNQASKWAGAVEPINADNPPRLSIITAALA